MILKRLGPAMTEIEFADGVRVLYSYETPAALYLPPSAPARGFHEKGEPLFWTSDKYVSRSTSEHVKRWINGAPVARVNHETMAAILAGR